MKLEEIDELIAQEIYLATMGDAKIVDWPNSNAENYRRIGKAVREKLIDEGIIA